MNIKKRLEKIVVWIFTGIPILRRAFIFCLKVIAHTGYRSNILVKGGVVLFPIHFYFPGADFTALSKHDKIFKEKSQMSGIDFDGKNQIAFLKSISEYADECDFPALKPSTDSIEYYTENGSFGYGCASILYSLVRRYKPKRIIEVGIGNSSKVISKALDKNNAQGEKTLYYCVDPFPPGYVSELANISKLIPCPVETLDTSIFEQLEENDILFIDSSHQVKIGNDVLYLYLKILPILKPGVIVHIHDISLPYEYPSSYFLGESFRVCWNEQYLLQAFLAHNSEFEVLLGMTYLMTDHRHEFASAFPHYDPKQHLADSGSFWMRRKPLTTKNLSL